MKLVFPQSQAAVSKKLRKGNTKTVKRKAQSAAEPEPEPELPSASSLLHDPRAALQELMSRHPPAPKDSGITSITSEIASYEASRKKCHPIPLRLALSKQVSRFKLPVDMSLLEALSPQAYLMKYCSVCKRRQAHYKRSFDKFDRDRDGILSCQEMEKALMDLYSSTITSQHLRQVTGILVAEESTKFTHKLFFPVCALSERLFYNLFEMENGGVDKHREKHKVEEADFGCLKWKFQGCQVSDEMKKLISLL